MVGSLGLSDDLHARHSDSERGALAHVGRRIMDGSRLGIVHCARRFVRPIFGRLGSQAHTMRRREVEAAIREAIKTERLQTVAAIQALEARLSKLEKPARPKKVTKRA
jgi:hypothetical protein